MAARVNGSTRAAAATSLAVAFVVPFAPVRAVGAQELPAAVLLRTHAGDGIDDGTARGFDRVLRQRIDSLGVVAVEGSVELDLEDVELALGCIGESEACLRAVAEQAGATILVFASIDTSEGTSIVSVLRFDARDGSLRRAVRTSDEAGGVLAAAEPLARELWDLPAVAAPPMDDPPRPTAGAPGLSPWPFVVTGLGAVALVGGSIALGLGFSDRDAYGRARPATPAESDAALARLDAAQTELLAGTVLLVVGGAIAATGTGWALGAGREDGASPLSVLPLVSPDGAGVLLAGALPAGVL